ncbi:glycosyltransferase [Telmatospirillum sp. J64-1]|uniref:UDP-N-acetylglucosamine--N-acetylmuramyl- (pentapeptide) pyrophosphoryl-undecaprenol N-acetylglucosamine transferase n=1 Tax=Telmatospirillum sp. J64-1 TaxID=2502183 RepID=UPI00115CFA7E|nr:UDP-N-acetylglucosamine--N-acetylmuramyl-(pentapeptide) pyrophosphoryl-undecaprenol N-acetylglucosamine transferase [Telmatospirillum sp. J64-1]
MTSSKTGFPKIALAGGYTAGHVMPMLAVAEAWERRFPGSVPLFLGEKGGFEADLLDRLGHVLHGVPGRPLHGVTGVFGRLASYGAVLGGMIAARRVLRREKAALVLGFGAYATAGILLGGRSLGLPTAIYEANVLPGLTNRRLARHVDLRFVNWAETCGQKGWEDALAVGLPVRRGVIEAAAARRIGNHPTWRLLVTGGSLGSAFLNRVLPPLAARLKSGGMALDILHQAGRGQEGAVAAAYAARGIAARVEAFLDDMPAAWAWADAAICAAGASTLAEVQARGLPVMVVPVAAVADGHQDFNAAAFSAATGHPWVREADWDEDREARRLAGMLDGRGRDGKTVPQGDAAAEAIVDACARRLGLG